MATKWKKINYIAFVSFVLQRKKRLKTYMRAISKMATLLLQHVWRHELRVP